MVHSSSLGEQKAASIDAEVESTEETLTAAIEEVEDQWLACEPAVEEAINEWLDDHDEALFEVNATVVEGERKMRRDLPGRPPADQEPFETAYRVEVMVSRDEDAISARKAPQSCYLVLTTIPSDAGWPPVGVLEEHKAKQGRAAVSDPERSKRVGTVDLKNPARVEAFVYFLILAVVVYAVIERRARRALFNADEPMRLVGGKTSFRPADRRLLERFENMTMMRVDQDTRVIPTNLDVPERVLDLLNLSVAVFSVEPSA